MKGNSSSKSAGSSRPEFREKFVEIYTAFFRGDDPSLDKRNFWEELFLLKVNVAFLEKAIDEQSADQLLKLKPAFNAIFSKCSAMLGSDHQICRVNALQTLCVLVRCVFRKPLSGVDMINVLVGFEHGSMEMQVLIENLSAILVGDEQASLKNLTFKFLLILLSAVDNISQNKILEYLMANNIFEPLSQILSWPGARDEHGYDCVVLLTFLLNYRKYESANPYIPRLSVLDNELVLNGLGVVISGVLSTVNKKHASEMATAPSWFGQLGSWVGGMFIAGGEVQEHPREAHAIILLSLYEAVHLNRNFMTILTQTHAQVPASSVMEHDSPAMTRVLSGSSGGDSSKSISEPVNLLGAFLTSASISMQDIKEGISGARARLCLNILTCICEDQYANAFLHDANMAFPVQLYKAPRRHRKMQEKAPTSAPLACAVLELVVELMVTHMCPKFQLELYAKCLGIIHRLLCYQKRCRIRLAYDWKGLWNALMSVGNYLAQNDTSLLRRGNILDLSCQIINLMNLFITYGDTFLPSPTSYDELYCEMIRNRSSFFSMQKLAEKHSASSDPTLQASGARLVQSLRNIVSLIEHFLPKIDNQCSAKHVVSLEREQVMETIRENYGSLTLRLLDNLDYYEKYSEKPHEKAFFTQLMRTMVMEVRSNIALSSLEQQSVLKEFTTIK